LQTSSLLANLVLNPGTKANSFPGVARSDPSLGWPSILWKTVEAAIADGFRFKS